MMKNPRLEEEKIIKDIRNMFRLKKELNYTANRYEKTTIEIKRYQLKNILTKLVHI